MTPPLSDASPATGSFQYHFSEEDLREFTWQLDGEQQHHGAATVATDPRIAAVATATAAAVVPTVAAGTVPTKPADTLVASLKNPEITTSNDVEDEESQKAQAQARSERKRSREKQRRSDVNRHFADLSKLIRRIEEEDESTATSKEAVPSNNRVDLIARTISLLEKLHDGNKKRKVEINNLSKELEDVKKESRETAAKLKEATLYQTGGPSNKVMMMVPMMVSAGPDGTATAAAAAPAFPVAQGFMPPHMGMPQMAGMQHMASIPMMHHMASAAPTMMTVMPPNMAAAAPATTTPPPPVAAAATTTTAAPPTMSPAASSTSSPVNVAAPAQAVAQPQQQGSPVSGPQQGTVWKGVTSSGNGGGNLAHCA